MEGGIESTQPLSRYVKFLDIQNEVGDRVEELNPAPVPGNAEGDINRKPELLIRTHAILIF
jgi:hypothetical protein